MRPRVLLFVGVASALVHAVSFAGFVGPAACYRDNAHATAATCAALSGPSANGPVTATVRFSSADGFGSCLFTTQDGLSSEGQAWLADRCDVMDFEEMAPAVAAWFLAMVSVLCVRLIYTRVFRQSAY